MIPEIKCEYGVFETIPECIEAADAAQKDLVKNYTLADRQKWEDAVRAAFVANAEMFANLEWEETGYGRVNDKIGQIMGTSSACPGIKYLPRKMYADNSGVNLEFYSPFGLIGALTPVTNPTATIVGNGVANLAAGNALVFNAHPSGKVSTAVALQLFNKTVVENGGPDNLLTMVKIPTMETLAEITGSPKISLIIGTGGPAMVATLMKSGKRAICAGPGNPPVIVDDSADVKKAAAGILFGSVSNNNIYCTGEKEYFVLESVFDAFKQALLDEGCIELTLEQMDQVCATVLMENPNEPSGFSPVKKFVGRNANVILEAAGIPVEGDPRMAFAVVPFEHPLVGTEQMMPIMPLIKCESFEQALQWAYESEHQNHHSAAIWTKDMYHMTEMARLLDTTNFAVNGPTIAALGNGCAGIDAPTISTVTGEGPTGPWSFMRTRRVAFADGLGYAL